MAISSRQKKIWIIAGIILAIFFIIFFLIFRKDNAHINEKDSERDGIATTTVINLPPPDPSLYFKSSIRARAVYVFDLTTKEVLWAKNENMPLPLASIAKLMTTLVASTLLSGEDEVTVSPISLETEGESGLQSNERWKFKDLRDFTLLVSSNDGASALALAAAEAAANISAQTNPNKISQMDPSTLEQDFVSRMNEQASKLQLSSFHFLNESGLDVNPVTPGGFGSAKDVANLLAYMIKNYPEILEITKYSRFNFTSLNGINHSVSNTDENINLISNILASKTGYTNLAGGNLVVAYNPSLNHPVIIVVLGSTQSGRFNDIKILASSTAAYLRGEE